MMMFPHHASPSLPQHPPYPIHHQQQHTQQHSEPLSPPPPPPTMMPFSSLPTSPMHPMMHHSPMNPSMFPPPPPSSAMYSSQSGQQSETQSSELEFEHEHGHLHASLGHGQAHHHLHGLHPPYRAAHLHHPQQHHSEPPPGLMHYGPFDGALYHLHHSNNQRAPFLDEGVGIGAGPVYPIFPSLPPPPPPFHHSQYHQLPQIHHREYQDHAPTAPPLHPRAHPNPSPPMIPEHLGNINRQRYPSAGSGPFTQQPQPQGHFSPSIAPLHAPHLVSSVHTRYFSSPPAISSSSPSSQGQSQAQFTNASSSFMKGIPPMTPTQKQTSQDHQLISSSPVPQNPWQARRTMEKQATSHTISPRKEHGNIQITPKGRRYYTTTTTTQQYATTPPRSQSKSSLHVQGQNCPNTPAAPRDSYTVNTPPSSKKINPEQQQQQQTRENKQGARASPSYSRSTPVQDKSVQLQQSDAAASTNIIAETPKKVRNGQQQKTNNTGRKNKDGGSSVEDRSEHFNNLESGLEGKVPYGTMQDYPHPPTPSDELPQLLYQPCINPSCPNIFNYAQENPYYPHHGEMVIQGFIQPPAWCTVSPCGCTLCRDCFSAVVTSAKLTGTKESNNANEGQTAAPYSSSDRMPSTTATEKKVFACIVCETPCERFGPINEELQNAAESAKSIIGARQEDLFSNNTHRKIGVSLAVLPVVALDEENESSILIGRSAGDASIDTAKISAETRRREAVGSSSFEGFQSAQDITPSKRHVIRNQASEVVLAQRVESAQSISIPGDQPQSIKVGTGPGKVFLQAGLEKTVFDDDDDIKDDHTSSLQSTEEFEADLEASTLIFPSLHDIPLPMRKISTDSNRTSSTATSNSTFPIDSPIPETPDLYIGGHDSLPRYHRITSSSTSSSVSAASSGPSTPEAETLNSPTFSTLANLKAVGGKIIQDGNGNSAWREKAAPDYYAENKLKTDNRSRLEREETIKPETMMMGNEEREREKKVEKDLGQLSLHGRGSRDTKMEQAVVGLGLDLGKPPAAQTAILPATAAPRHARSATQSSLSSSSSAQSAARPASKHQRGRSSNEVGRTPPRRHAGSITSVTGENYTPYAGHRSVGASTPSTKSKFRSRTDTHSSNYTNTSSSSHSSNNPGSNLASSFGNTTGHFRRISAAENRFNRLPEIFANPFPEMEATWEHNRTRWWKDPWNGAFLGVKEEKDSNGSVGMIKSDGSPLVKGRASGVSWPVLKIHNISFSTTVNDIEHFVPNRSLAPLEYNAQGVHVLCNLTDGKTYPYAYVECMSTEAAELLIKGSEGKFLTTRQVTFKPATQKDLAMDLYPRLRRGGYTKDSILGDALFRSVPSPTGKKGHARDRSTSQPFQHEANWETLDLFIEEDAKDLKNLMDITLQSAISRKNMIYEDEKERDPYFLLPTERPFARLASMIAKYPCHALAIDKDGRISAKRKEELGLLFECLIYALDGLAKNLSKFPYLRGIAEALQRAGIQCPCLDTKQKERIAACLSKVIRA